MHIAATLTWILAICKHAEWLYMHEAGCENGDDLVPNPLNVALKKSLFRKVSSEKDKNGYLLFNLV